jgi:tryptophan synthase beta chain
MERTKFLLDEDEMPKAWYNIQADLPKPLPPVIHPVTGQPIGPQDLAVLFPMELIKQEVSQERYIEIPEPVLDVYKLYRPSPLIRARRLEKALDTPAQIYFKYEGVSPVGSHKLNTSTAQAYYNKLEGTKRIATETGAGQWGTALAFACNVFGMECKVYMVKISFEQKPYRRILMETYGAKVVASPSTDTHAGAAALDDDPQCTGSLGLAISEAVEDAATHQPGTKYSLGSVLNHVLMHQTVIGLEAQKQFEKAGVEPDILIGCVGGGSNFGGFALPFVREKIVNKKKTRLIAVEPTAAPSLTKGPYAFDYGDTAKLAPIVKMFTLGSSFIPPSIHAGGLRYHGMAPIISALYDQGYIEAVALQQNAVFAAGVQFARAEGILPAPESAHAIRVAIDEALRCKERGEKKVIAFNLSGHGHFDMGGYDAYFRHQLPDYEYPQAEVAKAIAQLPKVNVPA